MSETVLRVGFYGVAFPEHTALLTQPLITGLLAAGVRVTLIDPPEALNGLRHPGLSRAPLRMAHRLVDGLYVGQMRLLESARATGLPLVVDLSASLFNTALPAQAGCLTPIENSVWSQARFTRPVMTLRHLPHSHLTTDRPLRIVSVMPLEWESGLEFAIDAVAQAIRQGASLRYTIVGDGKYADALIYGARLWGLWQTGHIQFQPAKHAAAALAEADLLLHTPYVGRFEPVVLEAMGRGLPIIVSDAPPLPQLVGSAAYQVARRQPDALCDMILRAYAQPEERKQLIAAALAQIADWENMQVDAWITAYRQALDDRTAVDS